MLTDRAAWTCRLHPVARSLLIFTLVATAALAAIPLARANVSLSAEDQLRRLSELPDPRPLQQFIEANPAADEVSQLRHDVARVRQAIHEPGIKREERTERIRQTLALRQSLIDLASRDPRHALWQLDQAADLYFLDLPIDGAGITTVFGLPDDEQRARARRDAAGIHDLALAAEREIQQTILALERSPNFAGSDELKEQRRQLDETERQRRIPYLRGIGAVLHAELNVADDAERQRLYLDAADTLAPLADDLDGALTAQARVYAGLALARLGGFDAADDQFRRAATDSEAAAVDAFAARLGAALNRAVRGGPSDGLEALDSIESRYLAPENLFFRMIIADQRFLLRRELARQLPEGRQRDDALAAAFSAYLDLLASPSARSATHSRATSDAKAVDQDDALRAIVLERLVLAAEGDVPMERLPPLVTIAKAEHLAKRDPADEHAVTMLRRVIERPGLDPEDRADALFSLGRVHWTAGRTPDAAETFLELSRDHPTDAQAEQAIELAVALAASAYGRDNADVTMREILRDSLQLLLERYPNLPEIERWRMLAAQLALAEQRLEEARAMAARVPVTSPQWVDAQFLAAEIARAGLDARDAEVIARSPLALDDVVRSIEQARTAVEARLRQPADAAQAQRLRSYLARLRVFEAEAQLATGHPQRAIELLQGMESQQGTDTAVIGEVLRTRIAAHRSMGRDEQAQEELGQYLQTVPEQAGPVVVSLLQTEISQVQLLMDEGRETEAHAAAQQELVPLARIVEPWLANQLIAAARESGNGQAAAMMQLRQILADALRLAEQWQPALTHYDALLVERPGGLELLRGRAECLFGLGGEPALAEAMQIYRRIAASRDNPPDEFYWQAQLRMMQILDRMDRNVQQIAPQIRRLRQQDPQLGGERFKRQFDALQNKRLGN
jgi:lipopolysaccharide biosynthesis regulator YciM